MLNVRVEGHYVVLSGADGRYEARLPWHVALELGSQLQNAAAAAEPAAPAGRTYSPKIGRWG
jgi:hypothetical protein